MNIVGEITLALGKIIISPQSTHWVDGKGFSFIDYNASVIIDAEINSVPIILDAIRLASERAREGDFSGYPGLLGSSKNFEALEALGVGSVELFEKRMDGYFCFEILDRDQAKVITFYPMQKINSKRWDPHKKFSRRSFDIDDADGVGRYVLEVWKDILNT